jgi:molybdate transport system ATP-binding protein
MTEPPVREALVRVRGLTKRFDEVTAVAGVDLDVFDGELLALLGPSGCGKTTAIRLLAGFERPDAGTITVGARTFAAPDAFVPPERRNIGVVFQDYALFPHMTARANVAAALGGHPRTERAAIADRWLATVRLAGLETRRPAELSGGQQQRVALARALARAPEVLLLDEPFAAIDRDVRAALHDQLDALRYETGIPVVLVTHSLADVRRLATRVIAIEAGHTIASGTVAELSARLDAPWRRDAAEAGSVIDATVDMVDHEHGLATLAFPGGVLIAPATNRTTGSRVRVHVPARDVILATARPSALSLHNVIGGTVRAIATLDEARAVVQLQVGDTVLLAEVTRDAVGRLALAPGTSAFALIKSVSLDVQAAPAP